MSKKSNQFLRWLAELFEDQLQRLNQRATLEARTECLLRMRILVDKLDDAIVSASEEKPEVYVSNRVSETARV